MSESAPRSVAKKPGTLCCAPRHRRHGVRLDIDEPAVDLAIGRPAVDGGDRLLERPVVEHGAVDERGRGGIDAGAHLVLEAFGDELRPPRPARLPLDQHLVHLDDPRRRKGARKRRGRAGGKGETRRVVEVEVALDFAGRELAVGELQQVVVLDLVDQRRIVDLDEPFVAEIVGERDEQVELLAARQQ